MKKLVLFMAIGLLIGNSAYANSPTTPPALPPGAPDYLQISSCEVCHTNKPLKPDEPGYTGPSFKQIADRYKKTPNAADMLAKRLSKGCRGEWSPAKVMVPIDAAQTHHDYMRDLVQYILSTN